MTKQSIRAPSVATPRASWGDFAAPDAVVANCEQWVQALGRVQHESFRFLQERLDKNARLFTKLAECRSADALVSAQADFVREAMEDCLGEFGRITSASTAAASQ